MVRDVFAHPEMSFPEIGLIIIFAIGIGIGGFTVYDIIIHDTYILPLTSNCQDFGNQTPQDTLVCQQIYEALGIQDPDSPLEIGSAYWNVFQGLVFGIGISLAVFRFASGLLAGARSIMLFVTSAIWFLSVSIPVASGYVDTFYYLFRGMAIPETLPWLNGVGFFPLVQWIGDPNMVESFDLIVLNVLGFGVLLLFLGWMHIHHRLGHFDTILDD